jgi:UDP-N-acetylmuramyl pentapeptide phosphotransferase/UDP-N-acetylglucosamine-1-phosphate transferase
MAIFVILAIIEISFKNHLFDFVDSRKSHKGAIPRLGGLSFFPCILFSIALILATYYRLNPGITISAMLIFKSLLICCGFIVLYLVGIADDLVGVRYRTKFITQTICAIFIVTSGLWLNNLYGLFGVYELSLFVGIPLTILVIVFIINAINLIDGIDGLASGLSSFAIIVLGVLFALQEQGVYALIAFATEGALVSFLYYNVFGKAEKFRKIFLGDTGSLTMGFIISLLVVKFCMQDHAEIYPSRNPVVIAFSLLIVPAFDVFRVVFCRWRAKKSLFLPDRNHIHHKFLDMAYSDRVSLLIILLISISFYLFNILLIEYVNITLLLFLDIFLWILLHILIRKKIKLKIAEK